MNEQERLVMELLGEYLQLLQQPTVRITASEYEMQRLLNAKAELEYQTRKLTESRI